MEQFMIIPKRVKEESKVINQCAREFGNYISKLEDISGNLGGGSSASYAIIRTSLKTIANDLNGIKKTTDRMGSVLESSAALYLKTESGIAKTVSKSSKIYLQTDAEGSAFATEAKAGSELENGKGSVYAKASADVAKGSFNVNAENGLYSVLASGSVLGVSAGAKSGYDTTNGNIKAYANAEAEAHGLKGEVSQEALWGLSKFKANGSVLSAAASAKASASLYQNGILFPSASAEAKAKAAVAEGKANSTIGLDRYNAHAEVSGYVVGAEASASAKVGVVEKDDKTVYCASAKASAGAYLAKGDVSTGFTVFGIKFDMKAGGNIGAGVEVKGEITSESIELGAGLSALLGLEAGIKIDWSNFGF